MEMHMDTKAKLNETAMMSASEREIIEESKRAKKAKENIVITPVSPKKFRFFSQNFFRDRGLMSLEHD